jgi:hypothetical protein
MLQKLYRDPTVSKNELLLDFLNIIIIANLLPSFTYIYTSRDSTYDVKIAERRAVACRSSRKKNTLYISNLTTAFHIRSHNKQILNMDEVFIFPNSATCKLHEEFSQAIDYLQVC